RDTELLAKRPAQVPVGDAQAPGDRLQVRFLERRVLDQARRGLRDAPRRVHARVAGRELRPAAQAGPEAGGLGGRRAPIDGAVFGLRRPHGAYGGAVDARRAHGDVEAPVEAGIVRAHGAVAGMGIERHALQYAPARAAVLAIFGLYLLSLFRSENSHWRGR